MVPRDRVKRKREMHKRYKKSADNPKSIQWLKMTSGFITRFLLLICLAWTQARMFMVSKPKVQDLPNWQLDADLKSSLEMAPQPREIPSTRTHHPSRSAYFRNLVEGLGVLGQDSIKPMHPMERRMEKPSNYGYGYGKRYLHQFKINN